MAFAVEDFGPEAIAAAATRIAGLARRTPLLRFPDVGGPEIWLKLENLQPIRSFKIRGAANAMLSAQPEALARGVWAASAGNMAQGVAYCARELGVPCTLVMPEGAPATKRAAVERLGGRIVEASFEEWFNIYETHTYPGMEGCFVHAFADSEVMRGNATIAAEVVDDLEGFDAVVVPYGGGGLSCGIAAALRHRAPGIPCYAAEVDVAAPLAAAFAAGRPVEIDHQRTFIDGIGGPRLFAEMWAFASQLLQGSVVSSVAEIRSAVRRLVTECAIVPEGAGAAALAASLAGRVLDRRGQPAGRVVCVVSGGNLDAGVLADVLRE